MSVTLNNSARAILISDPWTTLRIGFHCGIDYDANIEDAKFLIAVGTQNYSYYIPDGPNGASGLGSPVLYGLEIGAHTVNYEFVAAGPPYYVIGNAGVIKMSGVSPKMVIRGGGGGSYISADSDLPSMQIVQFTKNAPNIDVTYWAPLVPAITHTREMLWELIQIPSVSGAIMNGFAAGSIAYAGEDLPVVNLAWFGERNMVISNLMIYRYA